MRLKSIKLAGFKSFVDPTHVKLQSNMVAVVGPNGCGKSNIIDAVRWVMGESSAKNLRGESMADVIFNGSTGRKPVGQASIELIFDNSDATLLGEYAAFTEISIKRKVTRDGQSQYFLNGTKCRRRDITDIFLGTGLGPRSYAIIEQGMISRLIESKPEELRVFIEEAAGISKYKERRRETETRIRHTRENLERLTDLREELDRQLQRLKRQSTAAAKYKEYKAEERTTKAQTQALQWQAYRDQSSGQRGEISQHEINLEASIADQRNIDARIETHREEHTEKSDAFNAVQARFYSVGAEISRLEQTITHHEQRAQQLLEDLAETDRNAADSANHLREDRHKSSLWEAELQEIQPQLEILQATAEQSHEILQQAEAAMHDWQQRWDEFNENAAEPQKNAEVQKSNIDHIEHALKGLVIRIDKIKQELESLNTDPLHEQQKALTEQKAQDEAALADLLETIAQSDTSYRAEKNKQKEIIHTLDNARSQLQESKGRLASLEALQAAAVAADENNVNAWLSEHGLDSASRLIDDLDVTKGWEMAVETVLGESLQAVSVGQLEDVFDKIDSISEKNLSFIGKTTPTHDSGNAASGLPLLSDLVKGDTADHLFSHVYAAETIHQAAEARKQLLEQSQNFSIVTQDGVWMGPNWLKVIREKNAHSGVIERREKIAELTALIEQQHSQVDELSEQLNQLEGSIQSLEEEKENIIANKSQLEQAITKTNSEYSALEMRIHQTSERQASLGEDLQHAEENQLHQREALTEARAKLEEAIELIQQVESQREALLLERDKVRDELSRVRETANADRQAQQAITVRNETLQAQLSSVKGTIDRLANHVLQLEQRKASLEESKQENEQPLTDLRETLEQELAARVDIETELADARKTVESIDQAMRQAEQERAAAESKTQRIRSALEQLRIDSQSIEVRLKTIEEQLEESGFKLSAVIETLPEEADLSVWQEALETIGKRIDRLGPINLAAIDEYETESERKKYLDAQDEELNSALSTLENAIQKIDQETKSLFKDTFDTLNASLKDLFPKVFGGGTAYLELTGENLLDAGVAIMARPPGKRNSTIHLLSGGEKALTAIALVFSIFQLNPAPFCMLDEVDAPLDDANTGRYARLVKEMSDKVQFIFITHNKITMEMADHLMGVTMYEAGCSRMVSVDIDEAVELAAV